MSEQQYETKGEATSTFVFLFIVALFVFGYHCYNAHLLARRIGQLESQVQQLQGEVKP